MLLHFILVINFLASSYGSKAERRLYKDLLSRYNKLVRPVRNVSDALRVDMKIHLQQIMNLDGKNQIIELNAWLKFIWTDYRLSWKPEKYSNITSVRFAGGDNQIWRPDVLLYNSANEDFDSTFKSNEVVYSSGEVNWVPPGIFRATCKMDITYFPFDDQSCYLEFGSWTYNGLAVDLQLTQTEDEPAVDLSTYTPSGEWLLKGAPAIRRVIYSKCCPEPYITLVFFFNLRRRTLFYLFNLVFPSVLISMMTLLAFCLPPHDMSEKIGFQTTILLSICFFVTLISEMTPPTSESVPILGVFLSTLTLLISASTAFTITVLNIRYRQQENHHMSKSFYKLFLVWLPWLLLMKRPGFLYRNKRELKMADSSEESDSNDENDLPTATKENGNVKSKSVVLSLVPASNGHLRLKMHPEGECVCSECVRDVLGSTSVLCSLSVTDETRPHSETAPLSSQLSQSSEGTLLYKLSTLPAEQLHLARKVGTGILPGAAARRKEKEPMKLADLIEKYIRRCSEEAEREEERSSYDLYMATVVDYYTNIYQSMQILRGEMEDDDEEQGIDGGGSPEEWKFAAMALDRLCLVLFTTFMIICVGATTFMTPYIDA